ncbi:MAG: AMP-binding protein [Gammaproteobacteria bacterium]|nr:AMP-binding protein [Gammaproteobacteria bacterium]MDE0367135.1 AMP-binding protein [Gammaproteobacteria bacterium]
MSGNFFEELESAFAAAADRECLRVPGRVSWSYGDLLHTTGLMAGVLADYGVGAGDRVLAQVDKSPEALALYLATLRAGGIYVPLNTAYTGAEVDHFVNDAEPLLFVARPGTEHQERLVKRVVGGRSMRVLTLGADGGGTLTDNMRGGKPLALAVSRKAGETAALAYTSGTTGRAKGAMLTHANIASNAHALRTCWGWRPDDVLLHALPIFHIHGLFIALHCALLGGTPVIFLPRFEVGAVLSRIPEATVMMGVPTFYTRLLNRPELNAEHCAGMRLFISGSAPLTERTFRIWEERTGHRILERYGMSEAIIIASNPLEGPRLEGTVGFPLPGVKVRVADAVGREVPRGNIGTIEVRGGNVFKGYWRMPEKTAEEFRPDGYFVTGDLGTMDHEGRLAVVGRNKDLIISGGYNVYPKEVERAIDEFDEVVESAVIGVPHPDFGEGVVAVVVPTERPVEADWLRRALEQRLARFKQPKRVVNVGELPRNAMGKVQKNRLREDYAGLFADG